MNDQKKSNLIVFLRDHLLIVFLTTSIILGIILTFLCERRLTVLLFVVGEQSGPHFLVRLVMFLLYWLIFSSIIFLLLRVGAKAFKLDFPKSSFNLDLPTSTRARLTTALVFVAAGISLIFFLNNIFALIHTNDWTFSTPETLPTMVPVGNDFRVGLYRPANMLVSGKDIYFISETVDSPTQYPPLVNVFVLPFQLLNEDNAYLLEVFLLFTVNILCIFLSAVIVNETFFKTKNIPNNGAGIVAVSLCGLMLFYTLTSYPFLFSIERGNYDILALFFSLLCIYVLIKKPEALWTQVILLSIATHLKIYPAALFVILLIKHKHKMILPTLIVNVLFLFALGPENGITFIRIITRSAEKGYTWIGNHSAVSFAENLSRQFTAITSALEIWKIIFMIIPVLIWGTAVFLIVRKGMTHRSAVWLYMITIPLMELVPSVSHDYKLVILSSAILILFAMILENICQRFRPTDYLQILLVLACLFIMARSYTLNLENAVFINNKYPAILLLEVIMLVNIIGSPTKKNPAIVEQAG